MVPGLPQLPIDITKRALNAANLNGSDVIIFDISKRIYKGLFTNDV